MSQSLGGVPLRLHVLAVGITAVLCLGGRGGAQPFAGPGPFLEPQPGPPVVEVVAPRVTGNPFTQVWHADDLGGGAGHTGVVQHPVSGYVYVGNNQGVLEYDGARWELIPMRHGGAVLAVAIDGQGRVWAATENEIARLETDADGAWQAVTVIHPLPDGEAGAFDQILATSAGVWIRGLQHIMRVGADGGVSLWYSGERFGPIWWMDGMVHTKIADREAVRLEEGGKFRVVADRATLKIPSDRPSPFRVYASRQLGKDEWLLLTAIGPARWRSDTQTWRPFPLQPPLFREVEASTAAFLPDGSMVFVTTRPGGFVLTPKGRVERLMDRMPGVTDVRISQISADQEGGLWVSSRDQITRMQLRSAFARHEGSQGLPGYPRHIVRHGEELFIAHTAGVSRHAEWPGAFPPSPGLHHGAEALTIVGNSVFAAAAGLVELGNYGRQVRTWSNLAITTVAAVRAAPGSVLGGSADGVWWFRREGEAWNAVGRLQQLEAGAASVFDGGDGWVWGATPDGRLWRADFRNGPTLQAPVKFFGPELGVPSRVRTGRINFLMLGGSLVATCQAWMLRFDPTTGRFAPESRIGGLNATATLGAEAVGVNLDGTCWLRLAAPDRRILRLSPEGAERWQYEELPAPLIRDLQAVHLCEDRGTLWVAGKDLLTSIDLKWQAPPVPPLVARVKSATTGGARWVRHHADERSLAPLVMAEGDHTVRLEFAAPTYLADYRGRPCVQYRTWLEGFDREWRPWSGEPWRDFTKLPAGRYSFRLQVTDQTGRTSAETVLALVVRAPWWRTGWAWAGYVTATGLLLLGGVRLRTRSLRRRAARLEELVAARTEELRRSNQELARLHQLELDEKAAARLAEEEARLEVLRYQLNPHFLYNALNSIYSLALTTPPAAANMVLRLADFCRIALDRRHEEHTTVGAEFDKLSIYFEIEKVRWGESLDIAIEADGVARRAALPPFLLLPLVENAMKYGGTTSPEHLSVRVAARMEGDDLWLTVANTGQWVDRSGSNPPESGIGLANLRQRLQRYHPGAHELTIDANDGWVVVTLCLQAKRSPRAAAPPPAEPAAM